MPRRALGTVCQPATLGSLPEPETRGPSSPEEPSVPSQQQIRPSLASMATKDALRDLDPGWTKLRRREDDFLDSAPTRSRELTQGFPRLASSLRRGPAYGLRRTLALSKFTSGISCSDARDGPRGFLPVAFFIAFPLMGRSAVPRSVRFPARVWRHLERRAKAEGLPLHAALRAAVLAWINDKTEKL